MTTTTMTTTERAIALFVMAFICSSLIASVSAGATLPKVAISAMTFPAAMAVMGFAAIWPRITRTLIVGPIAGLLIASNSVPDILGHTGPINTAAHLIDLGESIFMCAIVAPAVEFSDPANRVRRWAAAGRSRWPAYYAVHLVQITLLLSAAIAFGAGLMNFITPVDWLKFDGFETTSRLTLSICAMLTGVFFAVVLALLNGRAGNVLSWFKVFGKAGRMTASETTSNKQLSWHERIDAWINDNKTVSSKRPELGSIKSYTKNGLPAMSWSQEIASTLTVENVKAGEKLKTIVSSVLVASIAGFIVGGSTAKTGQILADGLGGAFSLALAAFVIVAIALKGDANKQKSDTERRDEVTPVGCQEDCEAFIAEHLGELHLYIARGDLSAGPLPVVSMVLWDSFGNFEEGSQKQWFRKRGVMDSWPDWGVIIAQSNKGVVCVAESLHSNAWLADLLGQLQQTFVAPRRSMLREFRREVRGSEPAEVQTPITPF